MTSPRDTDLQYIQRVLESDAPKEDRDRAAAMVRDMRRAASPIAAQAEQPAAQVGPVGEVYRYGMDLAGRPWHGIRWYDVDVNVPSGTKLYTAPIPAPEPRQWQGLTTDELDRIDAPIRERGSATISEIYRAIEAALREKNAATAQPDHAALLKDAARYRWLRERLLGADFDWAESGESVLVFKWPDGISVGADCDKNIDAALGGAA